ncbi:chorismate mutase [Alteribacillus sp. HJP-4]|uniref:chorismate mutase n=1 Tax=Alteribacillus sp. HJP-4 TaxID=2775394 RepID=UPI0035CD1304
MIRGIRGATTVSENNENAILQATWELLDKIIAENHLQAESVAHIWFTVTSDLNAAFPAKVTRSFEGWDYVPVMCATEIPVPGSLEMCIRIMVSAETEKSQADIQHIYLRDAEILRPDLRLTDSKKSV